MARIRVTRAAEIFFGRTIKVSVAAVTILLATALALPSPAYAAGTPWTVTASSGSTKLAQAKGDFANNGGVYATAGINYTDLRNNGRGVYVQVDWWFYRSPAPGLPKGWVQENASQTSRTQTATWATASLSKQLRGDAQQVKAQIKVCEDVPNRGDICSPPANVSFSY
ncbi:hypothetical protein GCM10009610_47660 [Pseudonocardia xinjiangensis]